MSHISYFIGFVCLILVLPNPSSYSLFIVSNLILQSKLNVCFAKLSLNSIRTTLRQRLHQKDKTDSRALQRAVERIYQRHLADCIKNNLRLLQDNFETNSHKYFRTSSTLLQDHFMTIHLLPTYLPTFLLSLALLSSSLLPHSAPSSILSYAENLASLSLQDA